jgi:hypothetical protein
MPPKPRSPPCPAPRQHSRVADGRAAHGALGRSMPGLGGSGRRGRDREGWGAAGRGKGRPMIAADGEVLRGLPILIAAASRRRRRHATPPCTTKRHRRHRRDRCAGCRARGSERWVGAESATRQASSCKLTPQERSGGWCRGSRSPGGGLRAKAEQQPHARGVPLVGSVMQRRVAARARARHVCHLLLRRTRPARQIYRTPASEGRQGSPASSITAAVRAPWRAGGVGGWGGEQSYAEAGSAACGS